MDRVFFSILRWGFAVHHGLLHVDSRLWTTIAVFDKTACGDGCFGSLTPWCVAITHYYLILFVCFFFFFVLFFTVSHLPASSNGTLKMKHWATGCSAECLQATHAFFSSSRATKRSLEDASGSCGVFKTPILWEWFDLSAFFIILFSCWFLNVLDVSAAGPSGYWTAFEGEQV